MYKQKGYFLKHFDFFVLDTICLVISFLIGYLIRSSSNSFVSSNNYRILLILMIIANFIYYILFNPYKSVLKRSNIDEIKLVFIHIFSNFLFIIVIMFALQTSAMYSRLILVYTYIVYFFLSTITRIIWKKIVNKNNVRNNQENDNKLLVIANSKTIHNIIYNLSNRDFNKYVIGGIYLTDDDTKKIDKYKVVKNRDELFEYVVSNNINTVFIATDLNKQDKKIIKSLINEGIEIQVYIDSLFDVETENKEISNVGMYNTLQLNSYTFSPSQRIYFVIKRLLDIFFSIIGCILLVPIYIFIKVSYLLSGDNYPIIYTHTRVGLDGKQFELFKFRSMVHNADEVLEELLKDKKYKKQWENNQKLDDDPRITKIGKFIRKTSIDEMPQFINVLKGDMSIVGPRPLVPGELKSKNGIKLYERVKPGITGWWACNGRSDMSYEERLEHEYYYVKNCSLYLDFMCVLRTIYIVIFEKGAK